MKPAYRQITMAELRAVRPNGFRVASTFAGCGGSSTGYRMAGFKVAFASEFIPAAADTYEANCDPATIVDRRDVRKVTADSILDAIGLKRGELDVFDGSPPCASFSMAGRRSALWGAVKTYSDTEQRVDDLFGEYLRLLEGLQAKVAVAENVPGLTIGVARGFYNEIMEGFDAAGYVAKAAILEAEWLGVPQARHRLFFVAVRKDLAAAGLKPAFPEPLTHFYSIRDALPHLYRVVIHNGTSGFDKADDVHEGDQPGPTIMAGGIAGRNFSQYHVEAAPLPPEQTPDLRFGPGALHDSKNQLIDADRPSPTVTAARFEAFVEPKGEPIWCAHCGHSYRPGRPCGITGCPNVAEAIVAGAPVVEPETDIAKYAIGDQWDKMGKEGSQSEKFFQLVRPDTQKPCPTLTATAAQPGAASVVHPIEKRKFSVAELKALCAFPVDFVLTGSYSQRVERLGRAVMPPVTMHLGRAIAEKILIPWVEMQRKKEAA